MATTGKPLAVVTGASSGIGYELARVFAENGFDLVVCAEDGGIAEAGQAFAATGAAVETVRADLATADGVEQLWSRVQALGRPVDAIALNAGIGVNGSFAETDLASELRLVALNVGSTVHLAKRAVQHMVPRGKGRILITSSVVATMPAAFTAVYGASKAFDQSFAQALREELKDTGVTVTSLQPGATDTGFFERADMQDTKVGQAKKDDPAEVAKQGFEALMAGKDHVVAGSLKNRVQTTAAKVIPETVKAKLHRAQAEPGHPEK
jgi:short-subunit dehydrogenase